MTVPATALAQAIRNILLEVQQREQEILEYLTSDIEQPVVAGE